jgi:hypothetical protein
MINELRNFEFHRGSRTMGLPSVTRAGAFEFNIRYKIYTELTPETLSNSH